MASKNGYTALTALLAFLVTPTVLAFPQRSWNDTTSQVSAALPSLTSASPVPANTSTIALTNSNSSAAATALDPNAADCFITLPDNALSATGLSTPIQLMPPCSMSVGTQQAFAEAAVISPDGQISIYHPLIIDAGTMPAASPVVPDLPAGASVALWFGFNGGTLQLLDSNGKDTNNSPILGNMKCINGLPGTDGDIFGQVSWCNTDAFFSVANAAIASGKTKVPSLGTDKNGRDCPSSRSFTVVDQDMSDNLPTQYLLLPDGTVAQDTAANRAKFPQATILDNASDEALIGDIIDPLIDCTPFKVPSLDDPAVMVSSLATQELQAGLYQKAPVALVPLNDPDTILTSDGTTMSTAKTNAYRVGVNQPLLGNGPNTDDGSPAAYCNNLIVETPPFLLENQDAFTGTGTPDDGIGNNLFTFLCNRFLQSLTNLVCSQTQTAVTCQLDDNGVATSCSIIVTNATTTGSGNNGGQGSASSILSQVQPTYTKTAGGGHHHSQGSTTATSMTTNAEPSVSQAPPAGEVPPAPNGSATTTPSSTALPMVPPSLVGPATSATSSVAFSSMPFPPAGPTSSAASPAPPLISGPAGPPPAGSETLVTMTMFQTVTVTANALCTATDTSGSWNTVWGGFEWRYVRN